MYDSLSGECWHLVVCGNSLCTMDQHLCVCVCVFAMFYIHTSLCNERQKSWRLEVVNMLALLVYYTVFVGIMSSVPETLIIIRTPTFLFVKPDVELDGICIVTVIALTSRHPPHNR